MTEVPDTSVRVLVLDPIADEALEELRRHAVVTERLGLEEEQLVLLIPPFDAVVLRSGVKITAAVISAADRLKVIARAGSGTDNIDLEAAARAGIEVFNVPGMSARSVAELALGLMLSVARHISVAHAQVKRGVWAKSQLSGMELTGKTLGVVGFGPVGQQITHLCSGIGMNVVVAVRTITATRTQQVAEAGARIVNFFDLLTSSDVVCLAVPLTEDTHGMMDGSAFAAMKTNAILINVARGAVVDEDALFAALLAGKIAGAGLDVLVREQRPSPLFDLATVVVTPHLGAMTHDTQARIGHRVVDELRARLEPGSTYRPLGAR